MMRAEIEAVMDRDIPEIPVDEIPREMKPPKYRVTGVWPSTLNFGDAPNGKRVGSLPERTVVERSGVVDTWRRVRARQGFIGWFFSDFLKPV